MVAATPIGARVATPKLTDVELDAWIAQAEVERRTRDLDPFSEDFDTVTDGLTVQAYDTRVDADGRIALPKLLLSEVPLDASVVIIGRRSFFQIWSAPVWAERQAAAKPQPDSARSSRTDSARVMARPYASNSSRSNSNVSHCSSASANAASAAESAAVATRKRAGSRA